MTPPFGIGLTATVEPSSTPDTHQVRLDWMTPVEDTDFEIVRFRLHGDKEEITVPIPFRRPGRNQTYVDSEVLPVTGYRYAVRPRQDAAGELESVDVAIPGNEREVRGRQILADLDLKSQPIHRLILREGAELVTEGQDLELRLIELAAENAAILTFPEGSVAAPQQPGRHGGSISIHALRGSGKLTVLARGEKGGQGAKGDKGRPGKEGDAGKDSKLTRVGRTSEGDSTCSPAGNGKTGKPGGAGAKGHQGFPGGDSATVEISIAQSSELIADVQLIPGEGGDGGEGGEGGVGGPGGDRGSNKACGPKAKPGPRGAPGSPGQKGEAGPPGKRLTK